MNKFSGVIVRRKKTVIAVFLILAVLSAFAAVTVSVNYNMVDYLPSGAQSTTAIDLMNDEFGSGMPNAKVMISDVTIQEALADKEKLEAIDGVLSVNWLDDAVGTDTLTTTPAEFLDQTLLDNYYKDGTALFSVEIESGKEKTAVHAIRDLIGESNAAAGDAVNTAGAQEMSVTEVLKAFAILLPVILAILLLTTTSWVEPLLFLVSIGIAILINMGTNVFLSG